MLLRLLLPIGVAAWALAGVASSADCRPGKFGAGCNKDCHCHFLINCVQTEASTGCNNNSCGAGYKGLPGCQQMCGGSTFGINCSKACHCKAAAACYHISGQCPDGVCEPEYFSSTCSKRKPQLVSNVAVEQNDCEDVVVTWLKWQSGRDLGVEVIRYRLAVLNNATGVEVTVSSNYTADSANSLRASLKDYINDSAPYIPRVYPQYFFLGGYRDGLPSTTETPITRQCKTTTTPLPTPAPTATEASTAPTTATQAPPAPGTTTLTSAAPSTSLPSTAAPATSDVTSQSSAGVTTTTRPVTNKMTDAETSTPALVLTSSSASPRPGTSAGPIPIPSPSPSTSTSPSAGSTSTGAVPTTPGAPTLLAMASMGETWAEVSWRVPASPPPGGLYFVVLLGGGSTTQMQTSALSANLTGLRPGVQYIARVAAGSAAGPPSNALRFTFRPAVSRLQPLGLLGGASDPHEVVCSWTGPPDAGARLMGYSMALTVLYSTQTPQPPAFTRYWRADQANSTGHRIAGLAPATHYRLTITPQYAPGVAGTESGSAEFWTGPAPMSEPPPVPVLRNVGRTSFELELRPVSYSGGPLRYFLLVGNNASAARRRRRSADALAGIREALGARVVETVADPRADGGTVVTVGDAKPAADAPLAEGTRYAVFWVASSAVGGRHQWRHSQLAVTTGASLLWVLALVVVLLILILVVVALLLLWRRRQARLEKSEAQGLHLTLANGTVGNGVLVTGGHHLPMYFKNWSDAERLYDARYMVLDPEYGPRDLKVDAIRRRATPEDYDSFEREYRSLPCGLEQPCHAGRLPENAAKNRNPSILPYDHCRVTLDRTGTRTAGNDYVNANFVDGYLRKRAYIACQSPFDEETAADFWLMVYQYNVQQVVMMTQMLEEATMKCSQYWPECGSAAQLGAIYVTCVSEETFAFYTVRSFQILMKGEANGALQQVRQYQFLGWPEHGVPPSPLELLDMYTRVKMEMEQHMGPLVVHCGTGISRTAVFIALDSLLQQGVHENVVNVYKFCVKMRRARPNMVRTARQYMFLYDLIFEALLASNHIVNVDVRETFRQLSARNPTTGHSFLWEQHCILEKYTLPATDAQCSVARLPENRAKNRFSTILPADEHRVRLFSSPASADYINAVFVDSYFAPEDLILTQTPLRATLADFWRMLLDHKVTCVVDMEPEHRGREGAVGLHPGDDLEQRLEAGLTLHSRPALDLKPFPGVRLRRVMVNGGEHVVRVYSLQPGVWSEAYTKVPGDRAALVSLVQAVRADGEHRSGPLAVLCMDGATRSGLFAACFLTAQRLSCDHYVDVFHTVKALKLRRAQALPHLEQYKFAFKFLWDFVRRFMPAELGRAAATGSLPGHLHSGELESVYSHTQTPVLHAEQGSRPTSGVHYHYADSEALNTSAV